MSFDTLHVKIKCIVCKGTKTFNHGHHDPHEPHRWKRCPYCDPHGETYIEASFDIILKYFNSLSEDKKQEILSQLSISKKVP